MMNGTVEIEGSGAAPSLTDDKKIEVDDNAADPDEPAAPEGADDDDKNEE